MNGSDHYSNILLIEDDPDDQELFVSALKEISPHLKCIIENSALSALEKLLSRQIMADLIFLDLNIPGMNGFEFLGEVKKEQSLCEIPIVILSTTSQDSAKFTTIALGAKDFITKPNSYRDLVNIISYQLS
jgi:DNA-binding response OmpR family regulator